MPANIELRRTPPLGDGLLEIVDRMRQLVADTGDRLLLADGPPHPDARLLELCSDALHHATVANELDRTRPMSNLKRVVWSNEERRLEDQMWAECTRRRSAASVLLREARKISAATPAGVYAKALCVRASRTGAADLGMSLAEDLCGNPTLRASLWAAELQESVAGPLQP
jgi:hypothetical protein